MKPWVRTTAWFVFWATLVVALLLGLFVAWLLTEGLPPGTVITVDGERFVIHEFSHVGHWLAAALVVLVLALVLVLVLPVVIVLAVALPAAVGGLSLALGIAVVALLLWPLWLLGRRIWKSLRRPKTIAA